MAISSSLMSPILLLFAAAPSRIVHAADEGIDLYVREKFHDADGEPCGSCVVGDGCYLRTRSFFLRDACVNRGTAKSTFYAELEGGLVCRQDAPASCEDGAAFDAAAADDCRQSWEVDACAESERMTKLGGWCMAYSAAAGEYTVPLLAFREFDEVAACGRDSADYSQLLLPDEGGACVAMSYTAIDGAHVDGSRRGACDDGAFSAYRYATPDCTGAAQPTNLHGSSAKCPAAALGPFMYTEDCGAPKIHCKPSPLLGLSPAIQVEALKTAADEGGPKARERDGDGAGPGVGTIAGLAAGGAALLGMVGVGLAVRRKRRAAREAARGEAVAAFLGDDGKSEDGSASLQNDHTDQESIPPPPEMELGEGGAVDVVDASTVDGGEYSEGVAPLEEAPAKGGRKWGRFGRRGKAEEVSVALPNDDTDQGSIPPPPEMEHGEGGSVEIEEGEYAGSEEGAPEEAPAKGGRKWGRFGRK